MSMMEKALASARPATVGGDYELPLARPAGFTPEERRLIAIGQAVTGCTVIDGLAFSWVQLADGRRFNLAADLLARLLAAGDTVTVDVEATPADLRAHSEWDGDGSPGWTVQDR